MSKKTAPNKLRRTWRRARETAQIETLQALAALEGIDTRAMPRDRTAARVWLCRYIRADIVGTAMHRARRDFETNNPRPAGQEK